MYTAPLPTALVINDDPSQLHLMVGLLEKDGLQVVHCQSAEEALAILDERGTVDVIITDLHMPGIDGWRLCQLLRSPQYAALNTVPVLVVSATFSGTDTEQVTTDLGANAFQCPMTRRPSGRAYAIFWPVGHPRQPGALSSWRTVSRRVPSCGVRLKRRGTKSTAATGGRATASA